MNTKYINKGEYYTLAINDDGVTLIRDEDNFSLNGYEFSKYTTKEQKERMIKNMIDHLRYIGAEEVVDEEKPAKTSKTLAAAVLSAIVLGGCAALGVNHFTNPETKYEWCTNAHATGAYQELYNKKYIDYEDLRRLMYEPGVTSIGMSECAFLAVNGPPSTYNISNYSGSVTTQYIYRGAISDQYFYVTDGKVVGWQQ